MNAKKGQPQSWYSFSSGYSGITYGMSFAMGNRVRIELYINQGDAEKNKALFDLIHYDKDQIESELGEKLEWERLDDKQSSRIALYREGSIEMDNEKLQEIKNWSIDKLLIFRKILHNKLKKYILEVNKRY